MGILRSDLEKQTIEQLLWKTVSPCFCCKVPNWFCFIEIYFKRSGKKVSLTPRNGANQRKKRKERGYGPATSVFPLTVRSKVSFETICFHLSAIRKVKALESWIYLCNDVEISLICNHIEFGTILRNVSIDASLKTVTVHWGNVVSIPLARNYYPDFTQVLI